MRIVVNHLTRMQQGYMCVAGVDPETMRHVRPVVRRTRMSVGMLARYGGPFDMGRVVQLGPVRHVPDTPHVEDYEFDPERACSEESLDAPEFWRLLRMAAATRLRDLFGDDLEKAGRSCAVPLGKGKASLGCLTPRACGKLYLKSRPGKADQIRLALDDGVLGVDLPVTDIRLFGPDHVTPDAGRIAGAARHLSESRPVVLSVGLTRPIRTSLRREPAHWLQVNNLHFADNPVRPLG